MVTLEALAETALRRDSLRLRRLAQDFLRDHPRLAAIPRPNIDDQKILGTAAALLGDNVGDNGVWEIMGSENFFIDAKRIQL